MMARQYATSMMCLTALLLSAGMCTSPLAAQRTFRFGAAVSSLVPDGGADPIRGWTASLGYLPTTTSETALLITRYPGTGFGTDEPDVTMYGLESRYFPVEIAGVAPYFSTGFGLFSYETDPLLGSPTTEWAFSSTMGLGLGASITDRWWIGGEGRLRADNGERSTEYRISASYGVGKLREARSKPGTIEPFIAAIARLGHGAYRAESPLIGVRFRREESRRTSAAVDVGATSFADPDGGEAISTWVLQPAAEFGWAGPRGRPFIAVGPSMLGFIGGPDDGMRVGLHLGGGSDFYLSDQVELALLSRVTWFQSSGGRHQFGLQLGVAVGPRLLRDRSGLPERVRPADQ
jgi:hypothetical protein